MKTLMKLISGLMAALIILCSFVFLRPVTVEAADYTYDGREIPFLPEAVYGKDYVLIYQANNVLKLYVLPEGCSVRGSGSGGDSSVITLNFSSPHVYLTNYIYSDSTGWSEPEYLSSFSVTITPPNVFIIRSTVDIYNNVGDSSAIYFAKNANIITSNTSYIDGFGDLMLGSIGVFDSNFLGIMPFACMVCAAVFMFIFRMGRGF